MGTREDPQQRVTSRQIDCEIWAFMRKLAHGCDGRDHFKFADLEDGRRRRNKIMIRLKQADGERWLNFTVNLKLYISFLYFVDRAFPRKLVNKTTLVHNFFSIFINLYMFRATMGPSSGETIVFRRHLVLDILCG